MSLTGILASGLFNLLGTRSSQTSGSANLSGTPAQSEFQQLSQDLQAGNLSAARQDFANIERTVRARTAEILHRHFHFSGGAQSGATGLTARDFGALSQSLQSGNLAAAQNAFNALQQALEQPFPALDPAASGSQSMPNAANFLG